MSTSLQMLQSLGLDEAAQTVLSIRFLCFAGLTVLIWDSIITFHKELVLIWKNSPWSLRVAFGVNKYAVLVVLIFVLIGTNPPSHMMLSQTGCLNLFYVASVIFCFADATGNILTVFRLFILWGRNTRILIHLMIGAAVAFATSGIFVALFLHGIRGQVFWIEPLRTCFLVTSETRLLCLAMWAAQVVFDLYAVFLVFFNALNIPRTADKSLWQMLYEDRIMIIFVSFGLRCANIVLSAAGTHPSFFILGAAFIAPLISIANSRLILGLCATYPISYSNGNRTLNGDPNDDTLEQERDEQGRRRGSEMGMEMEMGIEVGLRSLASVGSKGGRGRKSESGSGSMKGFGESWFELK